MTSQVSYFAISIGIAIIALYLVVWLIRTRDVRRSKREARRYGYVATPPRRRPNGWDSGELVKPCPLCGAVETPKEQP